MEQDREVLRRLGFKVPDAQIDELLKIINSIPSQKEEVEKIRQSVKTPQSQDDFLHEIVKANKDRMTAYSSKITIKEGTYFIRAIDPEDIKSLTERAFFNSFNIERNKPNDLASQKNVAAPDSEADMVEVIKITRSVPLNPDKEFTGPITIKTIGDDKAEYNCICGKELPTEHWVRCDNGEENCKGSVWYHYSCVGLTTKDNVEGKTFYCKQCKGDQNTPIQEPPTTKRKKLV